MTTPTRLSFSRERGSYAMLQGPSVQTLRDAPRVLQVGLLTPCNLSCSFCYRDTTAPSRLDRAFLVPLLQQAAAWGVLEVALGGGEPLLFPELVPMLQALHDTTALGLNMTTNGLLLRGALLEQLTPLLGEVRISAYDNNRYQQTLKHTRHLQTGLNLMVTPDNVGILTALVHDALQAGADNVLLLGYKGTDPRLHLSASDRARLRSAIERMAGLPLRLDICLYPHFSDLPHLFHHSDCGAGDDFLTITPDRAVQACSFSTERHPFETFEDLKAIYSRLRQERPEARVGGCTRSMFSRPAPQAASDTVWLWSERAGNNSSTYTLIASFCDEQTARDAAEILQSFFADVHRFYREWGVKNNVDLSSSLWGVTNIMELPQPVVDFISRYEMPIDRYEHGIKSSPDAPTIVGVGKQLLLYHGYNLGLDTRFFQVFFESFVGQPVSSDGFGLDYYFLIDCQATGYSAEAVEAIEEFLTDPGPYRSVPWDDGEKLAVLWPHETFEEMEVDEESLERLPQRVDTDGIHLQLVTGNNLAAIAARLQHWLKKHGYEEIAIHCSMALLD